MSARRRVQWSALLVAVVATALAWFWRRQATAAREALAAVQPQIAAAHGREEALRRREAELARLPPALPGRPHAAAKAAPNQKSFFQRLQDDPAAQKRFLALQRAVASLRFREFFEAQKLSPDQIRQFLDNEMRREEAMLDLNNIRQTQGLAASDPAIAQLRRQAQEEYQTGLANVLGPDGLAQYAAYMSRDESVQSTLGSLAGIAAIAGVPLDPGQLKRLGEVVAAAPTNGSGDTLAAIIAQAGDFLSPAQIDILSNGNRNGATWVGLFQQRLATVVSQALDKDAAAGPGH